ncbi:hypothetical protein ACRYI5_07575 [Furfurilactobacillus sp. WILCCON 0119]|uniref:hypothetical protein n=1 Tax=Furfurilactobacillus entadae TaxID=2922307 RepID=UPI0035EA5D00
MWRKPLIITSIIFLIIAAVRFGVAVYQHNIWSISPIYAYNVPHGIVGWSISLAIVAFVASLIVGGGKKR